jgi:hypothetical protein
VSTPLRTCPPKEGLTWVLQAIELIKKKPAEALLFGNTYLFFLIALVFWLHPIGASLFTLIAPAMSFGMVLAGKMLRLGARLTPMVLFTGLTNTFAHHRRPLILLGIIYTVLSSVIRVLPSLVLGDAPTMDFSDMKQLDPQELEAGFVYASSVFLLTALCGVPVMFLFWFAPALVVWHNMTPVQALFSSWVAAWRNKMAFLVHGLALGVLILLSMLVAGNVFALLGLPQPLFNALWLLVVALACSVWIFSLYPSYASILEPRDEPKKDTLAS